MNHRVLVLMATYNGVQWVREQLDSILAQEGVDVSVMVGDDFSDDGTLTVIQHSYAEDARVQVCPRKNQSGSAGANFLSLYVQANLDEFSYVALADQDDIWLPNKLATAITALSFHNAQGYSAAVEAFWPSGRTKVLSQRSIQRSADFLFEGAGQGCTFVVTAVLFRRIQSLCRDSPVAVASLHYHDWLIYLLNRAWGGTWYFDAKPCMRYRQHGGNEIGARGGLGAITRRLEMIRNGWYLRQVKAAINLYQLAGGQHPIPLQIEKLMNSPPSLIRNLKLMILFLKHGRRSFMDRSVLSAAAVVGWL